jgi:hypothetical protein
MFNVSLLTHYCPKSPMPTLPASSVRFQKRHKVALVAIILAAGLLVVSRQSVWFYQLGWLVLGYLGTIWVLDRDLKHEEWIVITLLPQLWSVACLSWLLSSAVGSNRDLLAAGLYGLGLYAMLLAVNLLNVATVRTVPLARSAINVLQLATLACGFLLLYVARLQQPPLHVWVGEVAAISFLLAWPLIWFSRAEYKRLFGSVGWACLVALIGGQIGLMTGLWPSSFMSSLFIICGLMMVIGLLHYQEQRTLTRPLQHQFILLAAIVFALYYTLTGWGR